MAFKDWKPWQKGLAIGAGVLLVLYGAFIAVAVPSNGTKVHAYAEVGTLSDGSMYFRCVEDDPARASTPGSCTNEGDQATFHVHKGDRFTLTVTSMDGGGRAHDVKMDGVAYFLPPARLEMELHKPTESRTITAWMDGTFKLKCELKGHEGKGMVAHLVVE